MQDAENRVTLPDLGDIDEATVVEWFAHVGDAVTEGDDLVEVETSKTTFVVPAPHSGVFRAILAPAGSTVRTGDPLAELTRQ